jgi:hypothetical protein
MSSAQEALEKDDKASANKIKTNLRALTEESQEYSKKLLAGDLPNTLSDPGAELGLFLNNVVKREQKRYGGQLIRRTITSKDKNGNLIIELKPFVRIDALVKLRPHEKDLLQRVADDVASTFVPLPYCKRLISTRLSSVATENSKNNDFLTKV